MSTYASQQDVASYIEGWITDDPFALERLIQRCEQDVDRLIIPIHDFSPPTQVIGIGTAGGLPSGGSYQIGWVDYNGVTNTATLPFNATAANWQAAIQAWPAVGVDGNGNPNAAVLGTNPFTVIWSLDWARTHYLGVPFAIDFQIPQISVNTGLLQPASSPVSVVYVPGRRVVPTTDLNQDQALNLARAVSAQVEYRNAMGEAFFIRPQYESVRGPDFTTTGRLPRLGPKVKWELANSGLIMRGSRAVASYGRRGVGRGWPTY